MLYAELSHVLREADRGDFLPVGPNRRGAVSRPRLAVVSAYDARGSSWRVIDVVRPVTNDAGHGQNFLHDPEPSHGWSTSSLHNGAVGNLAFG